MAIYAKIRRMFYRKHLTISEIHRRTNLSRNTIKKWLQEPGRSEPKYQRAKATDKLTPFEPMLLLALKADSHRPKRDHRARMLLWYPPRIGGCALMLHTYSKYLATAITVFVSVCFVTNSHADTADNIIRASDTEILKIGKMMAEGVSKNSPAQIDSTTVLLGAIFVQETKTFIYKYKSAIRLDPNLMKQMIPPDTCSSPIRKNLMKRGMTFKHVYITPIGEQSQAVRVSDCP